MYLKNKRRFKLFYRNVYSHLIINFFFIAVQISLLILFIIRLQKYLEVYFGVSIVLSASFMILLINKKGKNEFKLAWIIPMVFIPLFSIAVYFMYHTNSGSRRQSKRLKELRAETGKILPPAAGQGLSEVDEASKYSDLIHYMRNNNSFYPYKNCDVKYFSCGEDFFPDLLASIRSAKKFIFMEYFIIEVDEAWTEIMEALEERIEHGVEVRILCDGLGSPVASSNTYQKYLKSKGIHSKVFSKIIPVFSTYLNNRDHRKIIVIDEATAYTGGLNLANEYFNRGKNRFPYWKDNAVRIQGEAVHTMIQLFLQNWNITSKTMGEDYQFLNGTYQKYKASGITIPYGDDFYNNKDVAENIYLYIINNAKHYLNITTPYILLDNQIQEAILFAAERGVEVSMIVPSVSDHFLPFCIGKTFLETFVNGGVKVYLYQKGFIHAKTFVSDDQIATVGSVNLDYRSLFHHFENGVVFIDSPIVAAARKDFENTLQDCSLMQKGDYKKIPLHIRFYGRLFRVFSPLM
ncbi:MAG: cardiolipin synthase [Treponema sp.]|nr:cardiolipin synthase [Treponema sp.]